MKDYEVDVVMRKKGEISNFILIPILLIIVGIGFFISSLFINNYYQYNKSSIDQITNFNEVLKKIKTHLNDKYSTRDSLEWDINHLLNYNEIKSYGEFIKRAIKEKDYEIFYLHKDFNSKDLPDLKIQEYLHKYFNKPVYFRDTLIKKLNSRFSVPNMEEAINELFNVVNAKYFYLDSIEIKPLPKAVLNSIYSFRKMKFTEKEELLFNLKQNIPTYYYNHYNPIFESSIFYGSKVKDFVSDYCGWIFWIGIILLWIVIWLSEINNKKGLDKQEEATEKEIEEVKEQIKNEPNKIKPSWDIYSLTLQKYFDKNLQHINSIYKISIWIMIAGFFIIISGIFISYLGYQKDVSIIAISSGILAEFIGATFLFIYKSTVRQALKYTRILEKLNNVGISMKILDTIEGEGLNKEELIRAKIEISKVLISNKSK